ncbi:MAG: hypothetical protein KJ737_06590 [Proteobacteria bacterium]|nr:hypothetical protein [Pseudomonadota bacterium]
MRLYRIIHLSVLILIFSVSFAIASFEIPAYVYTIDQLNVAQEKARIYDSQIVFLYSNKDTKCPLATNASKNILGQFRDNAVIVYICSEDWAKVPQIVRKAIKSPQAGRFIPKTIVVNSDITQVVSIIPYKRP